MDVQKLIKSINFFVVILNSLEPAALKLPLNLSELILHMVGYEILTLSCINFL